MAEVPGGKIVEAGSLRRVGMRQLLKEMGYSPDSIEILMDIFVQSKWRLADITSILRAEADATVWKALALFGEFEEDFDELVAEVIGNELRGDGGAAAGAPPAGGEDGADLAQAALGERVFGGILGGFARSLASARLALGAGEEGVEAGGKGGGGPAGAPGSVGGLLGDGATVPSEIGGLARELFLGRDPEASVEFLLQESGFRGPRIIRDFLTDQGDFFSALAGLTYLENLEPGVEFRFIKQALADFLGGTGGVTGLENVRRLVSELDINSPTIESLFGDDVSDTATFLGTVLAPFIPGVVLRGLFNSRNLRREEIQYKAAAARGYTGNALQWLIDRGLIPWLARSGQLSAEGTVAKPTETPFVEIPLAKKQAEGK